MDLRTLEQKCRQFKKLEGRASFYDLAVEIADEHPIQAAIIILATWNVARFRFMVSDPQNLVDLKKRLEECEPIFATVRDEDFRTVDFDLVGDQTKTAYSILSKVKGVEYTGTSKVFHLFCRDLIVMWDVDIRDEYEKGVTPEDFLEFQKEMQRKFSHIGWSDKRKTLPKAIDEYNYVLVHSE
ncbi:MAG: hypothetical protein ACE5IO_05820 [Thermoplasmata archaeon]